MEAFRHPFADVTDLGDDLDLDLDAFEASLAGSVIVPGSPDYDTARQVHTAPMRTAIPR